MQETAQFEIRLLDESDIPAAMRLKQLAGWNQTESDWRRLLSLESSGCFCASTALRVVGTTTTTRYGSELAWIGMVLVDPEYRRRGIATRLMRTALDYLRNAGVGSIKLDATPDGRAVYENLGFQAESLVERWAGVAPETPAGDCLALDPSTMTEILDVDRIAYAADRSKLIEMLISDAYVTPLVAKASDGSVNGYALAREGSDAVYAGPIVTTDAEQAGPLLDGLLRQLAGQRVYVDVNTLFATGFGPEALMARRLVKQRDLVRMCYGKQSHGSSQHVFAIAGPEFG